MVPAVEQDAQPPPPPPRVVTLGNGAQVRIRPLTPEDAGRLQEGLAHMSPESRRQRFLMAVDRLTPKQLEYLTHPDLVDHLALGMEVLPEDGSEPIGIGVARCVRLKEAHDLAEAAVAIADEWHGVGAGTALVRHLGAWARRCGIDRGLGVMLVDNVAARKVIEKVAEPVETRQVGDGVTEVVFKLGEDLLGAGEAPAAPG